MILGQDKETGDKTFSITFVVIWDKKKKKNGKLDDKVRKCFQPKGDEEMGPKPRCTFITL